MAMNGKVNQVRYVQTQDIPANYAANKAIGNDLSVIAPKPESQIAPAAPLMAKQDVITKSATKHSLAVKPATKTIQGETVNSKTASGYAISRRHHSTVRNADINRGGLISGIILLILGCILYALPEPIGYILGTIVVIVAVLIIVLAIL